MVKSVWWGLYAKMQGNICNLRAAKTTPTIFLSFYMQTGNLLKNRSVVWWKVCGEASTPKPKGISASWGPLKRLLRFFWNFTCELEIIWKIVYFWSWPDVRFRSPCFGGPKCPKMTFFQKSFQKYLKIFLVIDYNSASYYLLFRQKLIHFKGP